MTMAPRIPARRIVCWLTCQGSRVRGSPGTKEEPRLPGFSGKDSHLRGAQLVAAPANHPAAEDVDGRGQYQVEHQLARHHSEHELAEGRRLADQKADDQRAQLVEHGDDGDREEGRMDPGACRRLAVATGPEARER